MQIWTRYNLKPRKGMDTMSNGITIKQAATMAGVTPKTVRRWIGQGLIKGTSQGTRHNAPILVGESELRGYLATKDSPKDRDASVGASLPSPPNADQVIAALQDLITELRADKSRLLEDLDRERERNHGLNERIIALERELHSLGGTGRGIVGYLTTGWKRLTR